MRVLHLSSLYPPYSVGGAERVVEDLAEGMAAHGVSVAVAHLVPHPQPPGTRHGVDIFPLAHRNPLWIETSARYPSPVRNLNKLATLINFLTTRNFATVLDASVPDILHTHSMIELTPWMWKVAKNRGIPIVHTLQDFDLLCIRGALFKDGRNCRPRHRSCSIFSAIKKLSHYCIDHVVGASQSILSIHRDAGFFADIPETRQHVIWNPVRSAHRRKPAVAAQRSGPLIFGFIGRLVPEKGIYTLLDACRFLSVEGWRLKIAGRAPKDDTDLRARAATLPIDFVGYVDPDRFFEEIDVLVAPAIWSEPFGLTVVEGFAAGVPVLASDLGGAAEIVRAVEPGWLITPGDPVTLAARLSAMIVAGRETLNNLPDFSGVLARTDPAYVVARYLEVYRACLDAR